MSTTAPGIPYPAPSASEMAAAASAFNARLGVAKSEETVATGHIPVSASTGRPPALTDGDPGARADVEPVKQARPVERVGDYVRATFRRNAAHRRQSGTDARLLANKLDAAHEYSQDDKDLIHATGAPDVYLAYNASTRGAAVAAISEIETAGQSKCWTLAPTPWPELSKAAREEILNGAMLDYQQLLSLVAALAQARSLTPEQVQELLPPREHMSQRVFEWTEEARREEKERADLACERMEAKIDDQLTEANFESVFADCIEYLGTYGVCVVYGPAVRRRRAVSGVDRADGSRTLKAEWKQTLEFEAVNPMDCYPAPGAKKITDGPFVRVVRFDPSELAAFAKISEKDAPAWRRDAIEKILRAFPNGGVVENEAADWSSLELDGESGQTATSSSQIEGLQFFGEIRGAELLATGISKNGSGGKIDPEEYYEVEALTILDIVVSCRVVEPEIGRPLAKAEFYRSPESWWAESVLERVRTPQRVVNAAERNIMVNMAQASGPQVCVDTTRFDGDLTVRPWKRWDMKPPKMGQPLPSQEPLRFYSVPSVLPDLMQVKAQAKTDRDELSGIPAFSYGQTSGVAPGVTRTASVMSMLTEGATRGLKHVVRQIDRMVRDIVMRLYARNLLYEKDESLKVGDVQCNPSGVLGFALLEQNYNRLLQFLQLTGNPTDAQIIGTKGRAIILREIAKQLGLNPDKIIPGAEKLEELQKLNEAKELYAAEQQRANVEATDAANARADAGGENGGGEPSAPVAQAPEEETAQTPGVGAGVNNQRARQAAARRAVQGGSGPGVSPAANGTIRQTISEPRQRAAQGAASAETRGGG